MKKSKILIPALSIASVGAVVTPMMVLTSCNKAEAETFTEIDGTKALNLYKEYYEAYKKLEEGKVYNSCTFSSGDYIYDTEAQPKKYNIANIKATINYKVSSYEGMAMAYFEATANQKFWTTTGGVDPTTLNTMINAMIAALQKAHTTSTFEVKYYEGNKGTASIRVIDTKTNEIYYQADATPSCYYSRVFSKETMTLGTNKIHQMDIHPSFSTAK